MSQEKPSLIKIWQESRVLYLKIVTLFLSYLAQFLDWEAFQTKSVDKIKTHILCSINFSENCVCVFFFFVNVKEWGIDWQPTDDNIMRRINFPCWITNATDTHSEYVMFYLVNILTPNDL
jgi:hypothetical protein